MSGPHELTMHQAPRCSKCRQIMPIREDGWFCPSCGTSIQDPMTSSHAQDLLNTLDYRRPEKMDRIREAVDAELKDKKNYGGVAFLDMSSGGICVRIIHRGCPMMEVPQWSMSYAVVEPLSGKYTPERDWRAPIGSHNNPVLTVEKMVKELLDWWDTRGEELNKDTCVHEWASVSSRMCYSEYLCKKCGKKDFIDSSG